MSNTRPEIRADVNGKLVTRHVRVDDGQSAARAGSVSVSSAPSALVTKEQKWDTVEALGLSDEDVDHMLNQATETLIWSSSEIEDHNTNVEDGEIEGEEISRYSDLSPASQEYLKNEIVDFIAAYPELVGEVLGREGYGSDDGDPNGAFAHDFILTKNGEGAGFWDRPALDEGKLGSRITEALSSARNDISLEVGDDGNVHIFGAEFLGSQTAKAEAELQELLKTKTPEEAKSTLIQNLGYRNLSYTSVRMLNEPS